MEKELLVIEEKNALAIFSEKGALDPIIDEARKLVDGFEHNLTTAAGRKKTASLANKVAKFKVSLDGMGKNLVADWKEKAKAVDQTRKSMRDQLDELKTVARKPLTDWEEAEESRVAALTNELEALGAMKGPHVDVTADWLANLLGQAKLVVMGECWEEFAAEAASLKDEVLTYLETAHGKAVESEAAAVELARLQKEESERQQKECEEALRLEGEKRAKEEAEEEARVEAERVAAEKEKQEARTMALAAKVEADKQEDLRQIEEAKAETAAAKLEKIAAEERAKLEAEQVKLDKVVATARAKEEQARAVEQAKKDEASRIAQAKAVEEAKQLKLSSAKKHVAKIDAKITASLLVLGLDDQKAEWLLQKLKDNVIAHVTINY